MVAKFRRRHLQRGAKTGMG